MPILAASSGIVIPGCPLTYLSASAERLPLPFGRPALRRPFLAPALLVLVVLLLADLAAAALLRELEGLRGVVVAALRAPRGRPGLLRTATPLPPTPCSAFDAASRREYSSTSGRNSFMRPS